MDCFWATEETFCVTEMTQSRESLKGHVGARALRALYLRLRGVVGLVDSLHK